MEPAGLTAEVSEAVQEVPVAPEAGPAADADAVVTQGIITELASAEADLTESEPVINVEPAAGVLTEQEASAAAAPEIEQPQQADLGVESEQLPVVEAAETREAEDTHIAVTEAAAAPVVPVTAPLQQFGLSLFLLPVEVVKVEVGVTFDRPFLDENYSLVATTSHQDCYAVIKSKGRESAILEIVRSRFSPECQGFVNWIAMGRSAE
ncbi:WIAG-tail domain [Paenibacillus mucilaginosus]|nr:WIAG-tail domain [Paenibacillus mucilaginosus]